MSVSQQDGTTYGIDHHTKGQARLMEKTLPYNPSFGRGVTYPCSRCGSTYQAIEARNVCEQRCKSGLWGKR